MPEGGRLSLSVSNAADWEAQIRGCRPLSEYSSIWIRKSKPPSNISELLATSDREMAVKETAKFVDNFTCLIDSTSVVLNPREGRITAKSKINQLLAARDVGFDIPDTLMSNDPSEIRRFFVQHNEQVIYKPFQVASWGSMASEQGLERTYATLLTKDDLAAENIAFTSCPGIYQSFIAKKSELRVTFFGQSYFAVRIFSQERLESKIDFRADVCGPVRTERALLNSDCLDMCNRFAHKLGILHGSLDLIERPDGGITFLEVNEMGQYLFLEEWVPELRLLAAAVEFARKPTSDFVFRPTPELARITYHGFISSQAFKKYLLAWDEYLKRGIMPDTYSP